MKCPKCGSKYIIGYFNIEECPKCNEFKNVIEENYPARLDKVLKKFEKITNTLMLKNGYTHYYEIFSCTMENDDVHILYSNDNNFYLVRREIKKDDSHKISLKTVESLLKDLEAE